jgi:hypothetical protein
MRKKLDWLAEEYFLDPDASVQAAIGLYIEYGKKESRKATFSIWRTHVAHTSDGDELRVVQEIADQVCLNRVLGAGSDQLYSPNFIIRTQNESLLLANIPRYSLAAFHESMQTAHTW